MKNRLEVDSIIQSFGENRILSNIYLECETGMVVGVLGRNGTGKTTLFRIIFGELETSDKSIRLNGKAIFEPFKTPGLISFLPQFKFMLRSITVRQIFKIFEIDFNSFTQLFPTFKKFYKKRLSEMSGGERRIVEIYTLLKRESMFCLLDEPFSHVMPVHIEVIKELIESEKQKKGIILIDHLYNNVIDISDSIYIIENGKTNLVNSDADFQKFAYLK
jgi:ABC-type multidrug transport system ATPase subunit